MLVISKQGRRHNSPASRPAGRAEGCGLHIQKAADHRRLRILLVSAPAAGDFIHDAEGARLYVAEEVAGRVQDQTLDAARSEAGRVQFVLDHAPAPRMRQDITQLDLSSDDALLSA